MAPDNLTTFLETPEKDFVKRESGYNDDNTNVLEIFLRLFGSVPLPPYVPLPHICLLTLKSWLIG